VFDHALGESRRPPVHLVDQLPEGGRLLGVDERFRRERHRIPAPVQRPGEVEVLGDVVIRKAAHHAQHVGAVTVGHAAQHHLSAQRVLHLSQPPIRDRVIQSAVLAVNRGGVFGQHRGTSSGITGTHRVDNMRHSDNVKSIVPVNRHDKITDHLWQPKVLCCCFRPAFAFDNHSSGCSGQRRGRIGAVVCNHDYLRDRIRL
jgi:hypothetical protein